MRGRDVSTGTVTTQGFRASRGVRFGQTKGRIAVNESGLSDLSASLDYTEERPG